MHRLLAFVTVTPAPIPTGETTSSASVVAVPTPTVTFYVTPLPVPVEIVGDEVAATTALVVSIVAAVIGAIAAVASWRAATAARVAAESGKESATHSATAAAAAQKTAEYERATFEMARENQISGQAKYVFITWRGTTTGRPDDGVVNLSIENLSGRPITDITFGGLFDKEPVTVGGRLAELGSGQTQSVQTPLTQTLPATFEPSRAQGIITFTDANGLRWERRTSTAPITIGQAPQGHDQASARLAESAATARDLPSI